MSQESEWRGIWRILLLYAAVVAALLVFAGVAFLMTRPLRNDLRQELLNDYGFEKAEFVEQDLFWGSGACPAYSVSSETFMVENAEKNVYKVTVCEVFPDKRVVIGIP